MPRFPVSISSRPLGNQQFQELHDALLQHQVLFFRDQPLTLESQKELGLRFGALHTHPAAKAPEGHPEVLPIHADASSTFIAGENWHSDVSCDPEPPMGSILHLHTVPPTGGDTLFASMYAAYEALSDRMKAYLDGLTATHEGERLYRGRYRGLGVDDTDKVYPKAVHPVVPRHPVTGRRLLFVNPTFTAKINELRKDESEAILAYLYQHAARPEFQVRFRWQKNSVAFWDNRCVQHIALWDYFPQVRSGYRVTIRGERPAA